MNNAIFIVVNNNHFNYAIAMLNSLVDNWKNHPIILCHCDCDLTKDQIDKLKTYPNIELIPLQLKEEELGLCPSYRHHTMLISYGKLKAWSSPYAAYDNILVMDVDTIILKSLDDLMHRTEFTIFRSMDKLEFIKKLPELRHMLEEDNISGYFNDEYVCNERPGANSGIILIPKKYRTAENYLYMMYLLNRYKNYNRWADQAIINLWMLKNNIKPDSDVTYNFLTYYLNPMNDYWKEKHYDTELEKKLHAIAIIHFGLKPEEIMEQGYLNSSEKSKIFSSQIYDWYQKYASEQR